LAKDKHLFERAIEALDDPDCQFQAGGVATLFQGDDGLAGHTQPARQFLLGQPFSGAKTFQSVSDLSTHQPASQNQLSKASLT